MKIKTFLEFTKNKIYYHGSLNKFDHFKGDVFITENENFAYQYARDKASDFGIDDDVIIYEVSIDKCNIFDIKESNNKTRLFDVLPDNVEYVYNNFGFTTSKPKEEFIENLYGKGTIKKNEQFNDVKVGDIIPYEDYDGTYTYHLYYISKIEDNLVNAINLAYFTGSTAHCYFKFDKSLFYKEKYYNYDIKQISRNRKDFNMLYHSIIDTEHELHKDVMESIEEYITNDFGKSKYNRLYKFPIKDITIDLEDNWRFYENKTIRKAISDLGFDGYIAKEKNLNTICVYDFAVDKIEISKTST